jgi:hypothetical protein
MLTMITLTRLLLLHHIMASSPRIGLSPVASWVPSLSNLTSTSLSHQSHRQTRLEDANIEAIRVARRMDWGVLQWQRRALGDGTVDYRRMTERQTICGYLLHHSVLCVSTSLQCACRKEGGWPSRWSHSLSVSTTSSSATQNILQLPYSLYNVVDTAECTWLSMLTMLYSLLRLDDAC